MTNKQEIQFDGEIRILLGDNNCLIIACVYWIFGPLGIFNILSPMEGEMMGACALFPGVLIQRPKKCGSSG